MGRAHAARISAGPALVNWITARLESTAVRLYIAAHESPARHNNAGDRRADDRPLSSATDALKRLAAGAALEQVRSGMALGLGTGSTVGHLLDLLGDALRDGRLHDLCGVPTSVRTEEHARRVGIPLVDLADRDEIDLTIDGADEVSTDLDLIKGMGGALLREKMVAQSSRRVLVIADASKLVRRLGTVSPLPVEVIAWGERAQRRFLERQGATVSLRVGGDGAPVRSDNGNVFLDCRFPAGIDDPEALEACLARRAGIVETGLFLGIAHEALIADENGVRVLRRPR